MKECPSCALEVEATASRCPYCGYEFPQDRTIWKPIAVIVALLLIWPIIELVRYLL